MASFSLTGDPGFSMRFGEQRSGGTLSVSMDLGRELIPGEQPRVLKMETRVVRSLLGFGGDWTELFASANLELNEVFETLIPEAQRSRFQ